MIRVAGKLNYDLDTLAKTKNGMDKFSDAFKVFMKTGLDSIKNIGITGPQGKKIEELTEVIREKAKIVEKELAENSKDFATVIKNAEGFNEQTLTKRAKELAEEAKKTDRKETAKVF